MREAYRANEQRWRDAFVEWLGAHNARHAGLAWWAYTATAKNLLSSKLGNRFFQALALREIVAAGRSCCVSGASSGQKQALADLAGGIRQGMARALGTALAAIARNGYHLARAAWAMGHARPRGRGGIWLITLATARTASDPFFGDLASRLREIAPDRPVRTLAYLQGPYRNLLPWLSERGVLGLFGALGFSDLIWAAYQTLLAGLARASTTPDAAPVWSAPLLEEALAEDLASGGYLFHLLAYRAARRFAHQVRPDRIIYPFENKSLEKMLLLGVRAAQPACRIIGYQHTSITPRHTCFAFAPGEAEVTPLPDRILTLGRVTLEHLSRERGFPARLLSAACALRQTWRPLLPRRQPREPQHLLLALSSSLEELLEALQALKQLAALAPNIEMGVRPHPEFPLKLLPRELLDWLRSHVLDFTGSDLAANLEWCDAVCYVSSTVALEALMAGRPAVKLRLSEPLDPDPLLGDPPFRYNAEHAQGLAEALHEITALEDGTYGARAGQARAYVAEYAYPVTEDRLRAFVE